jgi:membrane protein
MLTAMKRLLERAKASPVYVFVRRFQRAINEDDLTGISGELAYRLFLSLFPFFIFLAALGGFMADLLDLDNPTDEIIELLGESVPADVASVLRTQVEEVVESQNAGLLSIAIVAAIWTASGAFMTLMKGMNRVCEVQEKRPIWKRYLLAVGLTLLAGSTLVLAFSALIIGQVFGNEIAAEAGLEGAAEAFVTIIRWPAVVLAVLAAVALVYWLTPAKGCPFRFVSPGSVLFTLAWIGLNFLFGIYLANFGAYDSTYGALAGVVVVMLWFYLTGLLLFLGAELNQQIDEFTEERERARSGVQGAAARPDATQTTES